MPQWPSQPRCAPVWPLRRPMRYELLARFRAFHHPFRPTHPKNPASRPSTETDGDSLRNSFAGARGSLPDGTRTSEAPLENGFPDGPTGNNLLTSFPSARPARDGQSLCLELRSLNPFPFPFNPCPSPSPNAHTIGASKSGTRRSFPWCHLYGEPSHPSACTMVCDARHAARRSAEVLVWSSDESSRYPPAARHLLLHRALLRLALPRPAETRVI